MVLAQCVLLIILLVFNFGRTVRNLAMPIFSSASDPLTSARAVSFIPGGP